jgi:hypothetical protein
LGAFVLAAGLSFAAGPEKLSVEGTPRWYEITGDGTTSSGACTVRAARTGKAIGKVEVGHRFLSFGVTDKWVTFAYNGSTGYVPLSAAKEVYPTETPAPTNRLFGKTLEQLSEDQKTRAEEARKSGQGYMPSALRAKLMATPDTGAAAMAPGLGPGQPPRGGGRP